MHAVILGASPSALSAARSLGRAGLEVVIGAAATGLLFSRSRYVARFEDLSDPDDAAVVARLLALPAPHERPFLLPTGDRYALLVANHQERLRSRYCFVCPSAVALEAIIDKAKLYETVRQHGFPHPNFHVVAGPADVDGALAAVPTPCYVKPALAHRWRSFTGAKVERADTPAALRRALERWLARGLVIIAQEIIPGTDGELFGLCTYVDAGGKPVGWRTKRKLRQYPVGAGNASIQEICDEPAVAELGLKLLAVTGHRGPATVEFRRDARSGRFVLMEINARLVLGQEVITRSGFDVPLIAYRDAKREPPPPRIARSFVRWISLGADYRAFKELRRRGSLTTFRWVASLLPCRAFAYFALDDPWPLFTRVALWLGSRMRKARGPERVPRPF